MIADRQLISSEFLRAIYEVNLTGGLQGNYKIERINRGKRTILCPAGSTLAHARGSFTMNSLPLPRALSTSTSPPWDSTIHFTMYNPRPVESRKCSAVDGTR